MLTLESIVKEANRKRKAMGIKVSEANYHPAYKNDMNVVLVEGSPFILEVVEGGTSIRPYFN